MNYLSAKEIAKKWNVTDKQVRHLCRDGRLPGAYQMGRAWLIPAQSEKPTRPTKKPINAKNDFSIIDNKKSLLDGLRPLTFGEVERLKSELLVEFTYNSNAIEGNTLTLQETAMVLEGITIDKKPLKDHLEVIGHKDAFEYVLQLVKDRVPLSERVIKEIHSLVLMDKSQDKGVYRKIPVKIMGAKDIPPQPILITEQMEQLMKKYDEMKKDMHIVELAAIFHLTFEGIHPFVDGNGRTGRLLLNLELLQAGFPAINVKFSDRKKYYDCFNSYYETGSAEQMINLIAEYVEEMLDKYLEILK